MNNALDYLATRKRLHIIVHDKSMLDFSFFLVLWNWTLLLLQVMFLLL